METKQAVPQQAAPVEIAAYSIDEFCTAHRLSKSLLFSLWRDGRGPRRMVMGRVVRITAEAAAEWRREIEAFPCGASTEWTPEARDRLRGSPRRAA